MESDIIRPCGGTDIVDGAVRNEGRGRPGGIFEGGPAGTGAS